MLELDLKGSIPSSIIRVGNHDQAFQIVRLRKVLAEYMADNNIQV